jgi:hypothetical protein
LVFVHLQINSFRLRSANSGCLVVVAGEICRGGIGRVVGTGAMLTGHASLGLRYVVVASSDGGGLRSEPSARAIHSIARRRLGFRCWRRAGPTPVRVTVGVAGARIRRGSQWLLNVPKVLVSLQDGAPTEGGFARGEARRTRSNAGGLREAPDFFEKTGNPICWRKLGFKFCPRGVRERGCVRGVEECGGTTQNKLGPDALVIIARQL